ncbi:MAG: hypothetical protein HGA66_16470, partial [Holophaga sp.]|nr:hypothetical protein [Holophaga sp.]
IVGYARSLLGRKDLEKSNPRFRNDCSGYVLGVFEETGHAVDLDSAPSSRTLSDTIYRALLS